MSYYCYIYIRCNLARHTVNTSLYLNQLLNNQLKLTWEYRGILVKNSRTNLTISNTILLNWHEFTVGLMIMMEMQITKISRNYGMTVNTIGIELWLMQSKLSNCCRKVVIINMCCLVKNREMCWSTCINLWKICLNLISLTRTVLSNLCIKLIQNEQ